MRQLAVVFLSMLLVTSFSCKGITQSSEIKQDTLSNMDTITFGAGCFWCVEAIFEGVKGVQEVRSGYSGGTVKNPSYKEVCNGTTGHAEVCQLIYNPNEITFVELLEVFFQTHNPTTLNQQGADKGTQYRSAIFYHTEKQRELAIEYRDKLDDAGAFKDPIVTEITAYSNFYLAGDYHQDYYNLNKEAPYCRAIIQPKLDKFKEVFKDKLK